MSVFLFFFFPSAELVSIAHNSKCKNQPSLNLYFRVRDGIACYRSLEPLISAEDLLQPFLRTLQ